MGGRGSKQIGEEFCRFFVELGGLQPDERVLDVGCGIGRMAVPLTKYLKDGEYEGFDVVPKSVEWCKENITPRYPNFRFSLADIHNELYNPRGRFKAAEYKFPYEDQYFDFVFLTSVLTHLLPRDMQNYLRETARVLKKDGRCIITFFLLNPQSLSLRSLGRSELDFKYQREGCRILDEDAPEYAVAYDEGHIRELYRRHNLRIVEPVHYGSWCGRGNSYLTYQDLIVAVKK